MRSKFFKRVISGVSAIALAITALPAFEFGTNDSKFDITASASDFTYTVTSTSGSSSAGVAGNFEHTLYGYSSGVRIYFAPKSLYANNKVHPSKLYSLSRSKSLYEFSDYSVSGYGVSINNNVPVYEFDGNDAKANFTEIPAGRILSKGTGTNSTTAGSKFAGMMGKSDTFNAWLTEKGAGYGADFESLKTWCDNLIGANADDPATDKNELNINLTKLIKGFNDKFSDDSGLPKSVQDLSKYCIVVEPVMVVKSGDHLLTVSYQDFFTSFNFANTTTENIWGMWNTQVIYQNAKNAGGFNAKIIDKEKGTELTVDSYSSVSGFGLFGTDLGSIITNDTDVQVSQHISFFGDKVSSQNSDTRTITNVSGHGCNSGKGQIVAVKTNGQDAKPFSSVGSGSNIYTTNWFNTVLSTSKVENGVEKDTALKYIIYGNAFTSKDDLKPLFMNSYKNNKANNKNSQSVSSKLDNFCRLIGASSQKNGTSTSWHDKVAQSYILKQVASYEFSKNGYINVSDLYTDYDIGNIFLRTKSSLASGVRDQASARFSIGREYDVTIGYRSVNSNNVATNYMALNRVLLVGRKSSAFSRGVAMRNSNTTLWATDNYKDNDGINGLARTENAVGNSITEALDASLINYNPQNGLLGGDANTSSSIGVSAEVYVKDVRVESGIDYIKRNADGTLSYGTTDVNKPEVINYSVFDTANSVFKVKGRTENNKATTYIVAIPNRSNQLGFNFNIPKLGRKATEDFASFIFGGVGDIGSLNTTVGLSNLTTVVTWLGGVDGLVRPLNDLASLTGESDYVICVGAINGDTSDDFAGYSVFVIEDYYVTPNQEVGMHLESKNLNYVYPTLLGDTEGHLVRTVSGYNDFSVAKATKGNSKYGGALIQNDIDMTDYISIFYNKVGDYKKDTFALEAINPKSFSRLGNGVVTLNHAVNFTRKAFNDSFTASAFNPNNSNVSKDYMTNVLGLTIGNTATVVNSDIPAGTNGLESSSRDKFVWTLNKAYTCTDTYIVGNPHTWGEREWDELTPEEQETYTRVVTYSVNPIATGEDYTNVGYNVTDKVYRYKTNNRDVGSITGGVNSNASTWAELGGNGVRLVSAESFDTVFNFTPEVAMEAYIMSEADYKTGKTNSGKYLNTATKTNLYVLGEKVRQVKASGVYITSVENSDTGDNFRGKSKSDTVAAGTEADALSKKLGGLQVVYAGGNINLSAQSDCTINVSGFMLDQIDKTDGSSADKKLHGDTANIAYTSIVANGADLKTEWGNADYNALANYEAYVDDLKSKLAVDVGLNTYDGSDVVKKYRGFKSSVGKLSGGAVDSMTAYALTFKGGTVDTSTEAYKKLIEQVAKSYYGVSSPTAEQLSGAAEVFKQSGIYQSILNSIESSTDADNHSGGKCECCGINKKTWYDEVVRTFVVRYFNCSPIKLDNIGVSDKVDIKAGPTQDDKDKTKLFSKGYTAKWNITVYLKEALDSAPDMVIYKPKNGNLEDARKSGSVLIAEQHVVGADFIISDATTADMRN